MMIFDAGNFRANFCKIIIILILKYRIVNSGFKISRYPLEIGRYLMDKHSKGKIPP